MQRPLIGAITGTLLAIGLGLWIVEPGHDSTLGLASIRVGIVMGVLWLAWPQLVVLPRWIMLTLVGAVAVVSCAPARRCCLCCRCWSYWRSCAPLGPGQGAGGVRLRRSWQS